MARVRRDDEFSGLALLVAGSILVGASFGGYLLGWLVDRVFNTRPWGAIIGLIIGTAIGFWDIYLVAARIMNRQPAPPPLPHEAENKSGEEEGIREEDHE